MTEQQIRAEIDKLESGYDRTAADGVKLAALVAAQALRWTVGDSDRAPSDLVGTR